MSGSLSVCVVAKDEERGRSMKKHTLPLELIREILLRLPVRSVLRFKRVCKSWLSLISDPQFGISHYDLAAAPSHRLLLRSNDFYVESIDIDAPLNIYSVAVHFFLTPTSPPCHREYDYYFHDTHEILGSYKGLIVLYGEQSGDLILWNPSIGAPKRLSEFEFGLTRDFLYGFGYDASRDDYSLILIALSWFAHELTEIQIFSVKTYVWKIDDINAPYKELKYEFRAGSLFNGALHWLVFSQDKMIPVIIAFDLIQRSLSEIPLLDHLPMEKYEVFSLRVLGGCLSVCYSVRGCAATEIWVMKEYKVQPSWTKSIVIPTYGFSPICITKDGGIFGSDIRGRLQKFNDKGELLEHLTYSGGQRLNCGNLQSAMYRESLLSVSLGEASEDDQQ